MKNKIIARLNFLARVYLNVIKSFLINVIKSIYLNVIKPTYLNIIKPTCLFVLKLFYVSKIVERTESPYSIQNKWRKSIWNGEVNGKISPLESKYNFGILRIFLLVIILSGFILPINFVRWVFHKKNLQIRYVAIDLYVIFKITLLIVILYFGLFNNLFVLIIVNFFLFEIFSSLFGRLLLSDIFLPIYSYKRSLLLLLINFLEQIMAFAILYLYSGGVGSMVNDHFVPLNNWMKAVYFSFVTGLTVGYGDYIPHYSGARTIVCWQIILTFLLIAVIISHFSGKIADNNQSEKKILSIKRTIKTPRKLRIR